MFELVGFSRADYATGSSNKRHTVYLWCTLSAQKHTASEKHETKPRQPKHEAGASVSKNCKKSKFCNAHIPPLILWYFPSPGSMGGRRGTVLSLWWYQTTQICLKTNILAVSSPNVPMHNFCVHVSEFTTLFLQCLSTYRTVQ